MQAADDAVDSDGLTTTGVGIKDADNMTLDSGDSTKTPKYSLGDYVWCQTVIKMVNKIRLKEELKVLKLLCKTKKAK